MKRNKVVEIVEIHQQERERIAIDTNQVLTYFKFLLDIEKMNIPIEFVFNCDETGCCSASSKKNEKVVTNNTTQSSKYVIKKSKIALEDKKKNLIKLSLIACISLNGEYLTPFVITKRATLKSDLIDTYGNDAIKFFHQENGFCNESGFINWLNVCFFPKVESLRNKFSYNGMCLLIYDGCSSHVTNNVLQLASNHNVTIKLLPPFTSHLLQPLDVFLFAPFKNTRVLLKDISMDKAVNFIHTLFNKFQRTFTSYNIVQSFEKVGIVHRSEGNQHERKSYFKVDVTKISEENHNTMGNILKDLTPEYFNKNITVTLPTANVC